MLRSRLVRLPGDAPAARPRGAAAPLLDPTAMRRRILDVAKAAGVGHIGSALSVVEIMAALFGGALQGIDADGDPRGPTDEFVLSKGHAALALYVALEQRGIVTPAEVQTYCQDGSRLGVHPDHRVPGIRFSTGSLGHGLSLAAGAALGLKLRGAAGRSFVLLSDAELNEGSTWEAVMFAAHHRLDNLVAIVDDNAQQALGATRAILDLQPLAAKWDAFGWQPEMLDGHDLAALCAVLTSPARAERPRVVLARTLAGKGVSFMEGRVEWHYWPLSDAQYQAALRELAA
jgi:transketolase